MTDLPNEQIEISRSATLGALFSVVGEILFGLTVIPLVLRTILRQGDDPTLERVCLYIAGAFVTAGWLLLRGKPRGGALRIPGGGPSIKRILSEVLYPAFAMFAVFCISIVAIIIIAAILCAFIAHC